MSKSRMSIVITTPTGNIGSRLAELLVESGARVTLIARHKEKVAHLAARGAEIIVGSHGDPDLLVEATRGADNLFLVTPPNFQTDDILAHYRTFAEAACTAIAENNISRVVHLSSVGAEQPSGTGPIVGLHHTEASLNKVAKNIVHLRPAYFMENTLGQIHSIASAGQLFTPMQGSTSFPMIATRDIADRAAALLKSETFKGQSVVELMGPEDMSYDKVAAVLSDVLGRPLKHTTVPGSALVESIMQIGGSKHAGEYLLELSTAVENGHIRFSGERNDFNRTPTTYRTFAETLFKAAFDAAA